MGLFDNKSKEQREQRRKERAEEKRKRWEAWKSRWTFRLDLVKEKTQLMWAKAARWKWLAILLGILAAIGLGVWAKFGGLF